MESLTQKCHEYSGEQMVIEKPYPSKFEGTLISLALILATLRASVFIFLFPDTSVLFGPAWIEIMLWVFVIAGFTYFLRKNKLSENYILTWRKNWLLALFILLTMISIFWSIGPVVTLFRSLELLFATLIAAYFGLRFRSDQSMEILFWFGAGLFILSIALVFAAPRTGTMYWAPFYGAWRGVYWHRNHLASITALLSAIYLCRMFVALQIRNSQGVLDGFFYMISLGILYLAKSATGYIVLLVLNIFVIGAWIWLRVSHRLHRKHYIAVLGIVGFAAILVFSNLDSVFGLFNRTSSLTGRTPLWNYLLNGVVTQRPWLGHGFGAFWTFDALRENAQQNAGWTSQPLIADNGFLDILIHVGIIGLCLFVGILITATIRSLRYAITQKTLLAFFPLLVMIYAFLANVSFSLFAETEVFVWFLIVAVLFMTTPPSTRPTV